MLSWRTLLTIGRSFFSVSDILPPTQCFRCSASNYLGKASSSARVRVDTDEPARAPEITTRPRSVRVAEGGIIEMTCVAEGAPYPDITWWNNNRIVSPNSRVSLSNTGQHLR